MRFVNIKGSCSEIIESLRNMGVQNEMFLGGIDELELVINYIDSLRSFS